MQVLKRHLLCFSCALVACGGDDSKKRDATIGDGAPDSQAGDTGADGAGMDAGGSKYIDVDGGTDCGIEAGPKYGQTWTCCKGAACRGRCVIEPDAGGSPFCYCAGVAGGCPGSLVCCVNPVIYPEGYCDLTCPNSGM